MGIVKKKKKNSHWQCIYMTNRIRRKFISRDLIY